MQLVVVVSGAVMRPALYDGTDDDNLMMLEEMGPLATRYHVWLLVLSASPGRTMAVRKPVEGQVQTVRSTTLD